MVTLVEKIVFSGIDGTTLILPLFFLLWFFVGQVKDCIKVVKKVLQEGQENTSN